VGIGLSQNSTIDALWDMAPSPRWRMKASRLVTTVGLSQKMAHMVLSTDSGLPPSE
jgi:hypothetical protein